MSVHCCRALMQTDILHGCQEGEGEEAEKEGEEEE